MEAIKSGELFGLVEVDIRVPDSLYDKFNEMSPIFITTDIELDDIGKKMKEYVHEHSLESAFPKRQLVGGMKAKQILLATPLIQFYLEEGLVIDKIHKVLEYIPASVFKGFTQAVTSMKREAAQNGSVCQAKTAKLLGNSAYGSILMNTDSHENISYTSDMKKLHRAVTSPLFRSWDVLGDLFEVTKAKRSVVNALPKQIGKFILDLAKLRILQFYYRCLDRFVSRSNYEMGEMDTDCCLFGTSVELPDELPSDDLTFHPLKGIIKEDMLPTFNSSLYDHCTDDYKPSDDTFFPRQCCIKHRDFDSFQPGLFHLEQHAASAICKASKHYGLYDKQGNLKKLACKGVNQTEHNTNLLASALLSNAETVTIVNEGQRMKPKTDQLCSYTQVKDITSLYCKRITCDDGVHTKPLECWLSPY